MIRLMLLILFFPFAIIFYSLKMILFLVLGILRLIGLVDIVKRF